MDMMSPHFPSKRRKSFENSCNIFTFIKAMNVNSGLACKDTPGIFDFISELRICFYVLRPIKVFFSSSHIPVWSVITPFFVQRMSNNLIKFNNSLKRRTKWCPHKNIVRMPFYFKCENKCTVYVCMYFFRDNFSNLYDFAKVLRYKYFCIT